MPVPDFEEEGKRHFLMRENEVFAFQNITIDRDQKARNEAEICQRFFKYIM